MKQDTGFVLWLTGLSGTGKTTIANAVGAKIKEVNNLNVQFLDGDILREAFTKPLGFSRDDRRRNVETATLIAKILSHNDMPVIGSFISPYENDRQWVKENVKNYIEIFVDTPVYICEQRDVKGLYKKARSGEIKNFTGLDDVYEVPKNPDLTIDTTKLSVNESVDKILSFLRYKNYIIST